jgi:hypothetical protein
VVTLLQSSGLYGLLALWLVMARRLALVPTVATAMSEARPVASELGTASV